MSDQLISARRRRHARTFPALNHVPEWAVTVRGEPPARYCPVICREALRSDWTPSSLRQNPAVSAAILVIQKYGLPRRCGAAGSQSRAEQSREG